MKVDYQPFCVFGAGADKALILLQRHHSASACDGHPRSSQMLASRQRGIKFSV